MKSIFLIFFAVICGSALANVETFDLLKKEKSPRGINDEILKAIENLKKQMPCGFPDMGIPVLAPFQKPYTEMNFSNSLVEMIGSIIDLHLDGLNVFDVNQIKFSALTLKATFSFNFNQLSAKGQYVANAFLVGLFKVGGKGDLDIQLKDFQFTGMAQLGVNTSGYLLMKDFNIVITLGGIKSNISGLLWGKLSGKLANKAIESFIPMIMKRKQEMISDIARTMVMEQANEVLNTMTIKDLLDLINNNKPKPRTAECVPEKPIFFYM